jgi:hypothetical protein
MTEMTGMFAKSLSKVLRFEQEVCGWEKMREDKAKTVDFFGGKVKTGQQGRYRQRLRHASAVEMQCLGPW